MEDYKKTYHKLFNALTDLCTETKQLAARMEAVQQECEDIIIAAGEEPPCPQKNP